MHAAPHVAGPAQQLIISPKGLLVHVDAPRDALPVISQSACGRRLAAAAAAACAPALLSSSYESMKLLAGQAMRPGYLRL
jgi:hypothetical protein